MKSNVYVSGSCKNRGAVKKLMDDIENRGYRVAVDWTSRKLVDNVKDHVEEDIKALKECDCFIYCMDGIKSRGKYFELGYVASMEKPIAIYLLPSYYITNTDGDIMPFDVIIENESVFVKTGAYSVYRDIDELETWLSNIPFFKTLNKWKHDRLDIK